MRVLLTLIMLMLCVESALAGTSVLSQDEAIKSIIGEAENQGYDGMLAVACAIRNRGTLKGVFGKRAPRVVKALYSKATYLLAKKAWEQSIKVDVTHGATHWENIRAFGKPYWVASMVKTYACKDHVFYRARVS